MNGNIFVTNVLVYSVAHDVVRTPVERSWLARGGSISVQVLNEFANTARRKLRRPWEDVIEAIEALRALCSDCISITEQTHHHAVDLAREYGFVLYDGLCRRGAAAERAT